MKNALEKIARKIEEENNKRAKIFRHKEEIAIMDVPEITLNEEFYYKKK